MKLMYFSIKYHYSDCYSDILFRKHILNLQLFVLLQSHLLLCWHGFCDVSVTLSKKILDVHRGLIPPNWLKQFRLHRLVTFLYHYELIMLMKTMKTCVILDQLAYLKPADLDLLYFQKRV